MDDYDDTYDDSICHCGRPSIVNECLGYTRGMCEDCDLTRCDAYPDDCPYYYENRNR